MLLTPSTRLVPACRSAMSPEERLGADTSLTTLASVTEVVISGDLQVRAAVVLPSRVAPVSHTLCLSHRRAQVAKVYVSFFGACIRVNDGGMRSTDTPAGLALR